MLYRLLKVFLIINFFLQCYCQRCDSTKDTDKETPLGCTTLQTCQGGSYNGALSQCPDRGTQRMSIGGNVTIYVKYAMRLPNRDATGPSAKVSDPYVRFTAGSVVSESSVVRNNLNPVWGREAVNLGVLGSATEILVEIWDHDTGLEFADDLLAHGKIRVPFCSTFHANYSYLPCKTDFGCEADDSMWASPTRQVCSESGALSFVSGHPRCDNDLSICLFFDVEIVPFTMNVELTYKDAMQTVPKLTAATKPQVEDKLSPWTADFGRPFSDQSSIVDVSAPYFSRIRGALMLSIASREKSLGAPNKIKFYASVNFPANIYVCRFQNDDEDGLPDWLVTDYRSTNITTTQVQLVGNQNPFECFYFESPGTTKNKWGGVIKDPIPFKSNTLSSLPYTGAVSEDSRYSYMYIVLAVPRVVAERQEVVTIVYDESLFVSSLFSYGLIWAWFMYLSALTLDRIDFKVERVSTFLTTRVLTGDHRTILATLFSDYGNTPCNIEFRAHLFHARNAMLFFLVMPIFLLISWGFSVVATVRPAGLGFGVAFLGIGAVLFWFGFQLWERNSWRLTPMSFVSQSMSVILFICYIIAVIFKDTAVTQYGHPINFSAISLVFGTINLFPLMLLVFEKDQSHTSNMKLFMDKLHKSIRMLKEARQNNDDASQEGSTKTKATTSTGTKKQKPLSANKLLHALLGSCYTINPHFPMFKYAPVVQETVSAPDEEEKSLLQLDVTEIGQGHELYNSSLVILFIYLMIAVSRTAYPSLAFLNCLTLMLFDFLHYNLNSGNIKWSPGKKIAVLVCGRLLIMGSGGSLWLLNYSIAYTVYSIVLIRDIIGNSLPMMTAAEAGKVVFAGVEDAFQPMYDMAATAQFALGFLTFAFVSIIVVSALGNDNGALPVSEIEVWRAMWQPYVFGLIAVCCTICGGLLMATARAFYLEKHGLLRGWARTNFMIKKQWNVPLVLAVFSEVAIITSGILIYGATSSSFILICSIFLPAIAVCFSHCSRQWLKNDFELIHWPPRDDLDGDKHDGPSDLDVAFNMIENIFGNDVNILPDDDAPETETGKTLKGFKLPSLAATGTKSDGVIKMPPLPLKSVLRRKRQAMGIKVKTPLVKDLKAREEAVDVDKFGDDVEDVIDANDPWAQFEEKDTKAKKKATQMNRVVMSRGGWLDNEYFRNIKATLMKYKSVQWLVQKIGELWTSFKEKSRKYAKVYITKKKEGDEDDEDLEDEKPGPDPNDLSIPLSERFAKMPFWSAALAGYLTRAEYYTLLAWFGGNFLIMIMGIAIAGTGSPVWYGHVLWVSIILFIFTFVPIIKYFNTYVVDATMKQMIAFVALFHIIFCASFFGQALHGDIGLTSSLWLLDYFFYFPAFLYIVLEAYRWVDEGFKIEALDKDGDNDITIAEYIQYFKAYPILLGMMIIIVWQFFVWIDSLSGKVTVIMLLASGIGYIFARDWAVNDHFLSPELSAAGDLMINATMGISFMVALFSSANPIFALSVFFFTYIIRCCLRLVSSYIAMEADTMFYFSPYVFPVYSYDSKASDVVDQSSLMKQGLYALLAGALWGACMATFLYPVNVGIAVACAFLLIIIAVLATAMSFMPSQLGNFAAMLTEEAVIQAASASTTKFHDRKLPLNLEMSSWDGDMPGEAEVKQKTNLQKQMERTSLDIAIDIVNETRALTHIHDDGEYVASKTVELVEEEEEEKPWYQRYWQLLKVEIKKMVEMIPMGKNSGWRRHSNSLFTVTDALAESLITGHGPYGFMGCEGTWYSLFKKAQNYPRLEFLNTRWLNVFDEYGNSSSLVSLSELMDLRGMLNAFPDYDNGLNYTYFEESRCAVHFLMLIMAVADSNLQREKVLFQKFLRENRFRLASNGISPPSAIFSSSSYSSIDIPLVAVWLSTLSEEERERYHALKATFSEEQKTRDEVIDADDYQFNYDAMLLKNEREMREHDLALRLKNEVQRLQMQRVHAFAETLEGFEAKIFEIKQEQWIKDADCFIENKNKELYAKFRAACMADGDEVTEYARIRMGEIETAQTDCRVGEYGRVYQYVDSEFLPGDVSVGDAELSEVILGWRCSPGISDSVQLFEGGTDPDDIEIGIFRDNWLLSALSMLAAGDGVGDGRVDDQIKNLFVGHYDMNGEITFHTELGGYCVRLFKQGMWHPVWVDDLFPMVKRARWTNENRGIASAHSKECRELWVSIIEKAYAKYLGSFGELSRGYVHHALQELTGCEAECIPLAAASRGTGKRPLWDMLIRYRKNGYIVGAGTGAAKLADKDMQDMGLMFNAAYTIYDVRSIDGFKLVKLRNPPGHHEEWKGDWGDKSKLWTRRLKAKLGWVDADDHTFYMSFDDFCNVFRYLFVCKWYDPSKWHDIQYPGYWKKAREIKDVDDDDMSRQLMLEAGMDVVPSAKKGGKKKDKMKAQIDTAGGLPTNHNPGCVLENNPHYTLQVHRTVDIRISVTQADSRGRASPEAMPCSILIVKNEHHKVPMRLKELTKENIVFRTDEPKSDRTVYLYATLKPGLYIILVPTYMCGMEGNFTLNVLSNYAVKCTPLWPPRWTLTEHGTMGKKQSMIEDGAGVAKEGMNYFAHLVDSMKAVLLGGGDEDEDEDAEPKEMGASEKAAIDESLDKLK